jgi:16S rRNA (guanine966-N2)-methyltransferase
MRIVSGKLKGSILYLPKDKNTRPLKDMVKESIFNVITHSNKISFKFKDSHILDLFSGTGSFGLECISRDAKYVNFVEKEFNAAKILNKNIEKFSLKNVTKIITNDVFSVVKKNNFSESEFDLIFCDPPFQNSKIYELIDLIINKKILKKEGVIILHRSKATIDKFPTHFKVFEERIYGLSKIVFATLA